MGGGAKNGGPPPPVTPADTTIGRRWTFGSSSFDERNLDLLVAGTPVKLERKPLEVLLYLLHHAGEVVTKQELLSHIWTGRVLTESVLTRHVSVLRDALRGDSTVAIQTVHGFGYKFAASVSAETTLSRPLVLSDIKIGDAPKHRQQWRLVELLGSGGHGEAWLARHEKTQDARVFKFAKHEDGLVSLRREITLYRVLRETLGARTAAVNIFEWNLESAPYFIETEYVDGRDLRSWAECQGGLGHIALETRLELVAQIADALAMAHSIGVLHKDLKPTNVLIQTQPRPTVRLCDFGSGAVVDPTQLDKLNITRLGLTDGSSTPATPLYLAPEVIAGQPFTMRADVYSLGVMLYQVAAGDLRKPLAPGWEADIADPLLREDISAVVIGNPVLRQVDAAQLSERLRTIDSRRQALAEKRLAARRAQRVHDAVSQLKRARIYAAALLLLIGIAVVAGLQAVAARKDAVSASRSATAINDFLVEDVLSVDPLTERPRDVSFESLLDHAANNVDNRLGLQPEAAGRVHWILGRRYQELGRIDAARKQYEAATKLFESLYGNASDQTLLVKQRLAWIYADNNRWEEALEMSQSVVKSWESLHGSQDLSTLLLRVQASRITMRAGNIDQAEAQLRSVLDDIPKATGSADYARSLFKEWLGFAPRGDTNVQELLTAQANDFLATNLLAEYGGRYREAEERLRTVLDGYRHTFGADSELTIEAQVGLGYVLAMAGDYEESEALLVEARDSMNSWLPAAHLHQAVSDMPLTRLRLEQRRPREALELSNQSIQRCGEGCSRRMKAEHLWDRGRAREQLGLWPDAIADFRAALKEYEASRRPDHVGAVRIRISLADALRKNENTEEAIAVLSAIKPQAFSGSVRDPLRAEFLEVTGLIALERRDFPSAVTALGEASRLLEGSLGTHHWRAQRASSEFASARAAAKHARS